MDKNIASDATDVTVPLNTVPASDGDGDGDDMPTNLGDICPECCGQPGR